MNTPTEVKLTVTYDGGTIPKTLRAYVEKHADKIAAISHGSGYCTDSGNAYDVMLRDGWCDSFNPQCHTIIESNVSGTLFKLRNIERCNCKDCRPVYDPEQAADVRRQQAQADAYERMTDREEGQY